MARAHIGGVYTLGSQPGSRLVGNLVHDLPTIPASLTTTASSSTTPATVGTSRAM